MQRASQRSDVRPRTLGVLVTAARPDGLDAPWFPRRVREAEPAPTFTQAHRSGSCSRSAVLKAVLRSTLAVTGTGMGDVQCPDPARGGVRIRQHTGLTAEFVDFFARSARTAPPALGPPGASPRRPRIESAPVLSPLRE
ncbi:hypothetical protein ABT116_32440 [Streptomyces sp. NPDC002130]|uniref:hypothetical protein n=1 Tax=Streptomyces sp. NPDC002130 TaxID=3155568 RepID=UPI00331EB496